MMETEHTSPGPKFYFAFPDGVLTYSCSDCAKYCCHEPDIGVRVGEELECLINLYPWLRAAANGTDGTVVSFSSAKRCYLLDDDGLCRAEKEHGRASKPAGCRVFPFVPSYQCADRTAVIPHFLCDLRIQLPPDRDNDLGSHHSIRSAILDTGMERYGYTITRFFGDDTAETFLQGEEDFRDSCSDGLAGHTFMRTLSNASGEPQRLQEFLQRATGLLSLVTETGISDADAVDACLHVMAPAVRFTMIHLPIEGRLRALALFEMMLRELDPFRPRSHSLRQMHSYFMDVGPAIRLLARHPQSYPVPESDSDGLVLPSRLKSGPLVLAAHAAVVYARKGLPTLDSLEKAMRTISHPALRHAFLVEFGRWTEQIESVIRT